jgi:hypothetical protein
VGRADGFCMGETAELGGGVASSPGEPW